MPVIGFLSSASPTAYAQLVAGFHAGLNETGYVEGRMLQSNIAGPRGNMTDYPH